MSCHLRLNSTPLDKAAIARAGAQFEGLLVQQMLSPLAESLGQFGSFAIAPLAQSLAAHDSGGFGAMLAALYEKQHAE